MVDTRAGIERRRATRREADKGSRLGWFFGGKRWQALPVWKRFLIGLGINLGVRLTAEAVKAMRALERR